MKVTCDIISDLLPLYIDGVCSEDSRNAVEKHLESCGECKSTLKAMSEGGLLSVEERSNAERAKRPFKKLRLRFLFWFVFGLFCVSVILITMEYAGAFDNIEAALYHSEAFIIEKAEPTDEWTPVSSYIYSDGYDRSEMQTEDYLEIRGLFRKGTLDCSFPFEYKATLRILDENGSVVVEPFEANGGMMDIPVKGLKPQTKYYVEYKSETGGNLSFNLR